MGVGRPRGDVPGAGDSTPTRLCAGLHEDHAQIQNGSTISCRKRPQSHNLGPLRPRSPDGATGLCEAPIAVSYAAITCVPMTYLRVGQ